MPIKMEWIVMMLIEAQVGNPEREDSPQLGVEVDGPRIVWQRLRKFYSPIELAEKEISSLCDERNSRLPWAAGIP